MVIAGHYQHRPIAAVVYPSARFASVTDGVEGVVTDVHAAIEQSLGSLRNLSYLGARRCRMNAGNEKSPAGTSLKQFDGLVDSLIASRQNHDRISLRGGRGRQGCDHVDEMKKAAEEDRGNEQNQ